MSERPLCFARLARLPSPASLQHAISLSRRVGQFRQVALHVWLLARQGRERSHSRRAARVAPFLTLYSLRYALRSVMVKKGQATEPTARPRTIRRDPQL